MKPIKFKEMITDSGLQNKEQPTLDLPALMFSEGFLSCWKLSFRDRISALVFGKVWLQVQAAPGEHPPIGMECRNSFTKKGDRKSE